MLLQFSFSNFRAFREQQTLNLAANGRLAHPSSSTIQSRAPGLEDSQWLRGAVLYGANAAGKSSLLVALRSLQQFILNSASVTDPKEPIVFVDPFAGEGGVAQPTAYEVNFVSDNVRYEYRVAATVERVWHESLRAFPKVHEQLWFCREWNPETQKYEWSPERPVGFPRDPQLEQYTLPNALFLSKAIANNKSELESVFRWFKDRLRFLDLSNRWGMMGQEFSALQLLGNGEYAPGIRSLLRHADLGVVDAAVTELQRPTAFSQWPLAAGAESAKEQLQRVRQLVPELSHQGPQKSTFVLPWEKESAGTHRLFGLAGPWLDILQNGYVMFVDELETSMHPLMVRELVRMFLSDAQNQRGAQLIMTTHNPLLLDTSLLRRDQIWFCDKDEEGAGHLYPLTDYRPRQGESLTRGYLSGRYGAVPFIPHGLLGETTEAGLQTVHE